jgi:predicted O-methyltransferase YrrM
VADRVGAALYSCDVDAEKIAELRRLGGDALENVHFIEGDSLDSLARIAARHEQIDFALFDSAPSATHTLHEFQLLEPRLGPGSRVLVDDAALPGARLLLSPCRKGKLLVPYLLASPFWRVKAHPRAGDSMVSAIHDRIGARADASYEDPKYVDRWREVFQS